MTNLDRYLGERPVAVPEEDRRRFLDAADAIHQGRLNMHASLERRFVSEITPLVQPIRTVAEAIPQHPIDVDEHGNLLQLEPTDPLQLARDGVKEALLQQPPQISDFSQTGTPYAA